MSIDPITQWMDIFGGQNSNHTDSLRQDRTLVEMATAKNVSPYPTGKLFTRPGFSEIRATALSGAPVVTGMFHLGGLADEFILTASDGTINRDNANPPGAISGGTALTSGATNLTRADIHEGKLIIVSQLNNVPQTIDASVTRADLGGTPPYGLDYKVFARRGCMFKPTYAGTNYRTYMSFNSANDDHDAWTLPITVNKLNFGRENSKANVLGGEIFQAHLMAFTEDQVFPVYQTAAADLPLAFQDAVMNEEGGGPPIIHSVIAADNKLAWISKGGDVKMMLPSREVISIGKAIQPYLLGLADAYRTICVGAWEPKYRLFIWAVAESGATTNLNCVALHADKINGSYQYFFLTISRQAWAMRRVSGQLRLIGGGYAGKFYNEFDSSTTGDLDNAASAIDADIITPRHHLGLPDVRKRVPFFDMEVDPIGSETITVSYRYDDDTSWTAFSSSFAVTGTDSKRKRFFFGKVFKRVQLRFEDANSGERFRLIRYGFPDPTELFPTPN